MQWQPATRTEWIVIAIIAAAVIVPTAIYTARWPNTLYEAAFPTAHSPGMNPESVLRQLKARGYGPYAGSFVDVRTEAEFEATLADIRRRGVQPERQQVAAPSAIVQDGPECSPSSPNTMFVKGLAKFSARLRPRCQ